MIMKFTSKINLRLVACGVLGVAGVGWMAWASDFTPVAAPIAPVRDSLAVQDSFHSYGRRAIIPAVEVTPAASTPEINYIPAHWYNNKSWWKRHAPIIGGAAGGGLIGGLAGGGKGALIGGAAGAGGGALYKHLKDNHHHGDPYRSNHGEAYRSIDQPTSRQPEHRQ
jgi:hypothetical protein